MRLAGRNEVVAEKEGIGEERPGGKLASWHAEVGEQRSNVRDPSVINSLDSRCDHVASSGPVADGELGLDVRGACSELPELLRSIARVPPGPIDRADHVFGASGFPAVNDGDEEFVAIFEVPVEASLGHSEVGRDAIEPKLVDANVTDLGEPGRDPVFSGPSTIVHAPDHTCWCG